MTPSKRDDSCEFSFPRGQISSKHAGGGASMLALHASVNCCCIAALQTSEISPT